MHYPSSSLLIAVLGLSVSIAKANPGFAPLADEHPGEIFGSVASSSCCVNGVISSGNSTGKFVDINGTSTYIAYPPGRSPSTEVAILYLTDIFGVQLVNNRILADSFAKAGYFVAAPDLFEGDPVPLDAMGSEPAGFNMTAWLEKHPQAAVEAIIESTIASLRSTYGSKKIGSVGYCFGGKYVARFLAPGRGLDAGFTAHPSSVVAEEWQAVSAPLSIAFGSLDTANNPAQRAAVEAIITSSNITFQTSLYSDAEHGFAVRTNLSIPQKKFAQEGAYFQAVRWLDAWVKN